MAAKKKVTMVEMKKDIAVYMQKRLQTMVYLLMNNAADLTDDELFADGGADGVEWNGHKGFLLSAIQGLDVALTVNAPTRTALLQEVTTQNAALFAQTKCLKDCMTRVERRLDEVQDAFSMADIQKMGMLDIDNKAFVRDCVEFARLVGTHNAGKPAQELVQCFPLRMARETFYTRAEESLVQELDGCRRGFAESLTGHIYARLLPDCPTDDGLPFAAFGKRAAAHMAKEIAGLDAEAYDALYEEAVALYQEMEANLEAFEIVFEAYQFLIALLSFADDADELLADNPRMKDVFCATVETLANGDYEAYRDNLVQALDDVLADALDAVNALRDKLMRNYDKLEETDAELELLVASWHAIDERFYAEMSLENMTGSYQAGNDEVLTQAEAKEMAAAFMARLKMAAATLPLKQQKALRSNLLTFIPFNFTLDELAGILQASLEGTSDFLQRALAVEKVGRLFEQYGYNPPDKDVHEHDEDCECGHHHHHHDHEDDCDCGHHHYDNQ